MHPRYWGSLMLDAAGAADGYVWLTYAADSFVGIQPFIFARTSEAEDVYYDVVMTIWDAFGIAVEE